MLDTIIIHHVSAGMETGNIGKCTLNSLCRSNY